MGFGLTTRHYSSRQSAGGWPLTGADLPQARWSKIGAGPMRRILRCVGVVNRLRFRVFSQTIHRRRRSSVVPLQVACPRCPHLRRRKPFPSRGNHRARRLSMLAALDSILQSRLAKSSTASTDGLPMLNFRRNFFLQQAPPVRFDTTRLSGVYPFATAFVRYRAAGLCCVRAGLASSR